MSLKVASKAKRKRKISNTPIPIICKSMRSCRQLIPCSYYELSRLHCVGDCIRRAIEICPHLNCTHLNQVNTGIFPFCKSDYLSELQFAQRMSFYTSLHREAMDAAVTLEDQDPHCSWPPKFQREFVKFSDRFRGIVHQYCLYYRKIMYLEWSLQHGLRRNFISMNRKKETMSWHAFSRHRLKMRTVWCCPCLTSPGVWFYLSNAGRRTGQGVVGNPSSRFTSCACNNMYHQGNGQI